MRSAREKRRRGELGFDDMLSRLDEALRGDSGETLASRHSPAFSRWR
ncbi:Exodeoxyribonuclease V beta chain [Klebsiella pneumoniae]|nr:Exodeoxyribonuclease V beta chain [Klebsiella pneumoniae]